MLLRDLAHQTALQSEMCFVYIVDPAAKEAIHYHSHWEETIKAVFTQSYTRTLLTDIDVSTTLGKVERLAKPMQWSGESPNRLFLFISVNGLFVFRHIWSCFERLLGLRISA